MLAPALRDNAHAIILIHNHPSGDPQPSPDDVEMTKQDDENFTGFALIRDRNGREGRLNCTARRTTGKVTLDPTA